jgi:hypothetical protein
MFPKEFRIASPAATEQTVTLLQDFIRLQETNCSESAEREFTSATQNISDRHLADLATYLWRIKERMINRETGQPSTENRRTFRHLQSAWDLLGEVGVRIRDHTHEIVPEGGIYSLKAIAYEPKSELIRETVIETIKPTVYFGDRLIQMGEVIIGTPDLSREPHT